MNANFLNRVRPSREVREESPDRGTPAAVVLSRACCCTARPAVQAVMPATARRPHSTELLLCAHHYRVSCRALRDTGASVVVLPGCPEDALLGDIVSRPAAAPGTAEADGRVRL